MSERIQQIIQAHGSDRGEFWAVRLMRGDVCIASVGELSSQMAACEAGEFLKAGIMLGWSLNRTPDAVEIDAGVAALNEPFDDFDADPEDWGAKAGQERRRVRDIIGAAWAQFVRKVVTTEI